MSSIVTTKIVYQDDDFVKVEVVDDKGNVGSGTKLSRLFGFSKLSDEDIVEATARAIRDVNKQRED